MQIKNNIVQKIIIVNIAVVETHRSVSRTSSNYHDHRPSLFFVFHDDFLDLILSNPARWSWNAFFR
jgi:hypothetical protein